MSYTKERYFAALDELAERERKWEIVCRIKGYVCSVCGEFPPKDDWPIFSETHMCAECDHRWRKLQEE